mmetsp:Transcript_20282/g.42872  ORF Transcript_20282/g.42872 Transcript_20282/m.42872 type:complete len:87 (-) Transcript_20282:1648-1908(-)
MIHNKITSRLLGMLLLNVNTAFTSYSRGSDNSVSAFSSPVPTPTQFSSSPSVCAEICSSPPSTTTRLPSTRGTSGSKQHQTPSETL